MKEIEILEKRKAREKHFLREDGTFKAIVYNDDIHYLKNGKYEEIDNTIVEEEDFYTNKSNSYKVKFGKKDKKNLMEIEKDGYYLKIKLKNNKFNKFDVKKQELKYIDILDNIDIDYKIMNNKVKEGLILKDKSCIDKKILFDVDTNLDLILKEDRSIIALKDNKEYFKIDAPFMIDSKNKENFNVCYKLDKKNKGYVLELELDNEWLQEVTFPVIVDPAITNSGENNTVYDTYIFPGDTNVDRNSQDYLKIGVERVNGVDVPNRALIKFNLPQLSTGNQIINAYLEFTGCMLTEGEYEPTILAIHPITTSWTEENANWSTMYDKYEDRIEGVCECNFTQLYEFPYYQFYLISSEITNIVKHWYTDKTNFGLMIKQNVEEYKNSVPAYFSSSNSDNKPYLVIVYRNQNGLENYMDLSKQAFSVGSTYINNYNGNLVGMFDIGKTIGGKYPIGLNMVYNTNDVVLNNNIGYGIGWQLDLAQTIKTETIEEISYLKYTDGDGTIHYFKLIDGIYKDEDGLNLTITDNTSYYLLTCKDGSTMKFIKDGSIGYLSEIKDVEENTITITYDSSKRIIKVTDANNAEITIAYNTDSIVVTSPDGTRTLNYTNNKLTSIVSYLGTVSFNYDSHNIIAEIIDTDSTKVVYEYYDIHPYRVKKVSEYGLNNTLGKYFDIVYQFNTMTMIDNKGQTTTKTFTNSGNLESISNLKSREDIDNAYGKSERYGEAYGDYTKYANKIMEEYLPLRSIKNYISNSSFESSTVDFAAPSDVTLSLSQEDAFIGQNSLKIVSTADGKTITRSIDVSKGKNYTFSAYLKTTNNVKLALSYIDTNAETVRTEGNLVENTDDFYRSDVTINYSETATSSLVLEIIVDNGTTYVDALQLEEGDVANNYNIVANSDFSNGYSDWNVSAQYHNVIYDWENQEQYELALCDLFEKVTLSTGKTALKINMNPDYITRFSRTFNISGKAGDVYTLSLWYKNKGIVSYYGMGAMFYNVIDLRFSYDPDSVTNPSGALMQSKPFNPNETEWQYFSVNFIAEYDYDSFELFLDQELNANEFYITDISLFKNVSSTVYDYDDSGNIILSQNLNNGINEFKYDNNNQLIKMTNPMDKNFNYEYDNVVKDRVIRGITDSGLSNIIKYDSFGNPIYTKIAKENIKEIINGLYKIRLKGTENYIRFLNNSLYLDSDECEHDKWYFEKVGEYFKIKHSIINDRYMTTSNNNVILTKDSGDSSLFSIVKNDNGSYKIKSKLVEKYLKITNNFITLADLIENDSSFEFYIEVPNQIFIENKAEYDSMGKYITSITDTLLNKTYYDVDSNTGLIKSIANSKGYKTDYIYNNRKRLIEVQNKDKQVEYEYNNQDIVSKITNGNVEYNFSYDEFNNTKTVKIGDDITLITNNYEINNGNLISSIYGNDDSILCEYDEFNRIKKLIKMDNVYNYKYGNNGDLVKIIDNNESNKYVYDIGKRLCEYSNNEFNIKINYDINNNIVRKDYKFGVIKNVIENIYNDEDSIIQTKFDENKINYNYDELGRITNRNINNCLNTNYSYVTNGCRTSLVVKSIDNNGDKYKYNYDVLGNITHIYHNGTLENEYFYDEYNQLIKEHNYILNNTIRYKYDNYGNILFKKTYKLNTYNQLSQNIYEYKNVRWKDQLTKFNDDIITYDAIGNPLNIGNTVLTWINGRQLASYDDGINQITYKYNIDGIRNRKIINNVETIYKLEGKNIIFEKTNNNVIYYIRNGVDDLIGFKYNNEVYYYQKNNQNDIIGILDCNYNIVAKYQYDSFGKVILITDGNDNIITDNGHVAHINPYRYRGYYYDKEIKLYYLNNRYYNPEWGRFINADGIINANRDIVSCNLYAYVSNNFVNKFDSSGRALFSLFLKVAIAVVVAKVVALTASKICSKSLPLASKMLDKSLIDNKKTLKNSIFYDDVNNIGAKVTQNSKEINDIVSNGIKNSNGTSFNTSGSEIFNSTKDLHLSINKADYVISGTKIKDNEWLINVHLDDKYDFEWLPLLPVDDGFVIKLINNGAYLYQSIGLLTTYEWEIEYQFIYRE